MDGFAFHWFQHHSGPGTPRTAKGFGLAVQEAKILGKPVAASDLTSIKEQITDGRNGFLFALDERTWPMPF